MEYDVILNSGLRRNAIGLPTQMFFSDILIGAIQWNVQQPLFATVYIQQR